MDLNTIFAMGVGEYSVFHYYTKYDNIESLEELRFTIIEDNNELEKWIRNAELGERCFQAHNFVKAFNWFMNHSDGTKEPVGLSDERFYTLMQDIRNKFYEPTDSVNDLPY